MKQKQTPKKQVETSPKKIVKKQQLPLPKTDDQDTLFALIRNKSLTSIDLRNITMEVYVNRRNKKSHIARYTLAIKLTDAKKIYKKNCKSN